MPQGTYKNRPNLQTDKTGCAKVEQKFHTWQMSRYILSHNKPANNQLVLAPLKKRREKNQPCKTDSPEASVLHRSHSRDKACN